MNWVDMVWSMVAAACLTLAGIHLLVWLRGRAAWGNAIFAFSATATAAVAMCELSMMHATTPQEWGSALRWFHLPAALIIFSLVGFVRVYLRAGRPWLAWTICGTRAGVLLVNFLTTPNFNFSEVTELRHVWLLGEAVAVGVGVRSPWTALAQASLVLLLAFVADAALSVWRRGQRRKALVIGGSMTLFVLLTTTQLIIAFWGLVDTPLTPSVFYLGIIAAMAFELSHDVLRASTLSVDLQESATRMSLAVEVANFGICIRDFTRHDIWASDKWRQLFGFAPTQTFSFSDMLERVHPDDRPALQEVFHQAIASKGSYETEFRLLLPDGNLRWISSRGRVEFDPQGQPLRIRGASHDCTARKLAEQAAHDLSGRLIAAQEDAQRQLARDLHDDFSQRLALLSVELEMFGQNPPTDSQKVTARMADFANEIKSLSSEIHHLSHNLHPAKLDQLGLVAAVRGFCKEFALAQELAIEFREHDVPRVVPADAALCLYRITQEALHNIAKHSAATTAKVELSGQEAHLHLAITDDGVGFDPLSAPTTESLGVVSMSERARFVGGRLSIQSRPNQGTRVEVRVPVARPIVLPETSS